jgi:hypothetical protein
MTDNKWGPEIPVTIIDGKRPDWLREDQVCQIRDSGIWYGWGAGLSGMDYDWNANVTAIKLLADDPYYQTLQPDEPKVTLEALEAAAKYAGYRNPKNNIQSVLKNPEHYQMSHALARMIMKHEPHLIEKSFEDRTAYEFNQIWANHKGLEQYQNFIKQHIKDAGK